MQIPTYLSRRDAAPPESAGEPSRCVVADNGVFVERRSPMFTTSVRVPHFDLDLARHDEYCVLRCGRIPRTMHRAMLSFFKRAHGVHGGEAALVLLFHPARRTFRWHCPEQVVERFETASGWVTGDTIEYANPLALPEGHVQFGDAHLHVGAAIPSLMDLRDDGDGLHIIVGHIKSTPSYHVDFVMDGRRFPIEPDAIFDDVHCEPIGGTPSAWLKRINWRSFRYVQRKC
jgi:hypothetical protein